ncbi:TonB family protein [Paracoccus sp. (in: a-proteobacteria)]|uniref:TonB family protein n=1 Tax=Paracoccus sp. TaxID=267 RepID=UPI003A836854
MFRLLSLVFALALTSAPLPLIVPSAEAQTVLGKKVAPPQNRDEWMQQLHDAVIKNIGAANSALAVHQPAEGTTISLRISVLRDGTVQSTAISKSSGSASLDKAVLNAAARTRKVAPFPPDMTEEGVQVDLTLVNRYKG